MYYNRSFNARAEDPIPVVSGEELDVRIESIGSRGDGVVHVGRFVVFVRDAEIAKGYRVRITSIHQTFAHAVIVGAI